VIAAEAPMRDLTSDLLTVLTGDESQSMRAEHRRTLAKLSVGA
jgi:hypothetical protein